MLEEKKPTIQILNILKTFGPVKFSKINQFNLSDISYKIACIYIDE